MALLLLEIIDLPDAAKTVRVVLGILTALPFTAPFPTFNLTRGSHSD